MDCGCLDEFGGIVLFDQMKVLFWNEVFPPTNVGGGETLMRAMVPEWLRRGIQVTAVANHGPEFLPDETLYEGASVHRYAFHRTLLQRDLGETVRLIGKIKELKQRVKPDLIHLHSCQPSLFFHLRTLDATDCPILLTIHDEVGGTGKKYPLAEELVRTSTWISCVSQASLVDLQNDIPETRSKSVLIRNALPFQKLPEVVPVALPPRILFAGRLVRDKGLDVALEALALLRGRFPELKMDIAGRGKDRESLEALAQSLGLEKVVRFLGQVEAEQMGNLYAQSSLVLVPSRWREPFGLVALEAAYHGKPVIASSVGGLAEIVLHEKTGLLVGKEDPAALAGAIASLWENPQALRQMGEEAQRRAEDDFSFHQLVSSYMTLYQQLTNR
jgi:glycogen(starch) synthase